MKSVWKFELPIEERVVTKMPTGAKLLCAKEQRGKIVVYAEVDPGYKEFDKWPRYQAQTENRHFSVFPTGYIFEAGGLEFLDTVQIDDYVFHVYYNK